MDSAERRARAERMYREVTTTDPFPPQDSYTETTLDAVFGELWTRPGITRKERRWITLTCVGFSAAPTPIAYHIRAALVSGDISRGEMEEFILHFAHYAGWPLSSTMYTEFTRLCAELDAQDD